MKIVEMDLETRHSPGEFCIRVVFDEYFISCFETPYLYETDGVLRMGNAGDILMHPPGTVVYHGDLPDGETGFINDWIRFSWPMMEEFLARYPIPQNTPFSALGKPILKSYIAALRDEEILRRSGYMEYSECLLHQMLIEIYRASVQGRTADDAGRRLSAARYAIMKNPQKKHTVAELARLCGYSPGRFSHLYKQLYGMTPMQNVLEARIEMAKRLLAYGGMAVGDVAEACGFQNIYYFSRCFKERTGTSPSSIAKAQTAMPQ